MLMIQDVCLKDFDDILQRVDDLNSLTNNVNFYVNTKILWLEPSVTIVFVVFLIFDYFLIAVLYFVFVTYMSYLTSTCQ